MPKIKKVKLRPLKEVYKEGYITDVRSTDCGMFTTVEISISDAMSIHMPYNEHEIFRIVNHRETNLHTQDYKLLKFLYTSGS